MTALTALKISKVFDRTSSNAFKVILNGSVSVKLEIPWLAPQACGCVIPVANSTALYAPQTSLGPLIIDGTIGFAWIRDALRRTMSFFHLSH